MESGNIKTPSIVPNIQNPEATDVSLSLSSRLLKDCTVIRIKKMNCRVKVTNILVFLFEDTIMIRYFFFTFVLVKLQCALCLADLFL